MYKNKLIIAIVLLLTTIFAILIGIFFLFFNGININLVYWVWIQSILLFTIWIFHPTQNYIKRITSLETAFKLRLPEMKIELPKKGIELPKKKIEPPKKKIEPPENDFNKEVGKGILSVLMIIASLNLAILPIFGAPKLALMGFKNFLPFAGLFFGLIFGGLISIFLKYNIKSVEGYFTIIGTTGGIFAALGGALFYML